VLFADLVGFTTLASKISGPEIEHLLNYVFSTFDGLAERHGLEKIQVSQATRALLGDRFELEERGSIAIKGKGEMRTWFLKGRKPASAHGPSPASPVAAGAATPG
jgi:class 3 adenylate cyclase